MKKLTILIISSLIVTNITFSQTDVSGNVSGTWTTFGSPYIVTNNIVLQPDDTLTISPGVQVKFDGNYRLDIFGTFFAVGNENYHITFTKNGGENWMSLNFADSASDSSRLEYCIIEYASSSGYEPYMGAVNCNQSNPTILNNQILNCSEKGISLYQSNAYLSGNVLSNIAGYGVYASDNSSPSIIGNTFSQISDYGIYIDQCPNTKIKSNQLSEIWRQYVVYLKSSDDSEISSNIITDISYDSSLRLIYTNQSNYIKILDNQIRSNSNATSDLTGIYLNNSNYASVKNNVLSDNTAGNDLYMIYLSSSDYDTLQGNSINNNSANDYPYGIYIDYCREVQIFENTIHDQASYNNSSVYGIHLTNSSSDIVENLIYSNSGIGTGIRFQSANFGRSVVKNNTINGFSNHGIYWNEYGQEFEAKNNSITNNGYGLYCGNSTYNIDIAYNNSWNNSEYNYGGNLPEGTGNLTDVNINGNVCDIYYNISENPLYADVESGNFTLQTDSPNIDAGDPDIIDPDGTIGDIGYIYYHQIIPSISILPESISLSHVPVGSDTTMVVQIYNPGDSTLVWSVSADSAWVVPDISEGIVLPGDTTAITVVLNASDLSAGDYTPNLIFLSNDPDTPTLVYTLTIRIVNTWRVNIIASAGGLTDDNNILGFDEDATDGLDQDWDIPEPPPTPINYLQMGFTHPEWSDDIPLYSSDIRYYRGLYLDDVEVWACSLSTDLSSSSAALSFAQSDNFPDDYSFWVIDGTDTTDVTATGSYNIVITEGSAVFEVMVKGFIPPAPIISISNPVSGQIFRSGEEVNISWSVLNEVVSYTLIYNTDGSNNWIVFMGLDVGTNEYLWTIPELYSTNVFIGILGYGLGGVTGFETVGPLAIIPASLDYQLTEGWNLISLPLYPTAGMTFADIFTNTLPVPNYIFSLPSGDEYMILSDSDSVSTSLGYWIALFQNANVTLPGETPISTESIPLTLGWNLISCPQPFNVDTQNLEVVSGVDTLSFIEAVVSEWLASPALYSWDSGSMSYFIADGLQNWHGHWLATEIDNLELLISPVFSTNTVLLASERNTPTPQDWEIILEVVITGFADRITKLGVAESATEGFDPLLDYPEPPPPPGGQFIEAYFPHDDWSDILGDKYNFDIRDPLGENEETIWDIEIDGNSSSSATLTWGDMNLLLPDSYTAWLYIPSLDYSVDMFEVESLDITQELPVDIQIVINSGFLSLNNVLALPESFALHQNYPNPFNPITSLSYDLPEQTQVTLTIYDLMGKEVAKLVNTVQEAGFKSVQWNATDMHGKPVSAGVYLYQIRAGEFVQTKKMVLLK